MHSGSDKGGRVSAVDEERVASVRILCRAGHVVELGFRQRCDSRRGGRKSVNNLFQLEDTSSNAIIHVDGGNEQNDIGNYLYEHEDTSSTPSFTLMVSKRMAPLTTTSFNLRTQLKDFVDVIIHVDSGEETRLLAMTLCSPREEHLRWTLKEVFLGDRTPSVTIRQWMFKVDIGAPVKLQ